MRPLYLKLNPCFPASVNRKKQVTNVDFVLVLCYCIILAFASKIWPESHCEMSTKTQEEKNWLRTDEREEFVCALEYCAELTASLKDKTMSWKWLIIALHNALQGACVCALRGKDTTGISVLTKNSGKKMWQWLCVDSRKNPTPSMPEERLAAMTQLYKRASNPKYLPEPHTLPPNSLRGKDVRRLNQLRNDFIHFVPKGLSLEISGMPRIVGNCCDAIEHLAIKHPTFQHQLTDQQQKRIQTALTNLRKNVEALNLS